MEGSPEFDAAMGIMKGTIKANDISDPALRAKALSIARNSKPSDFMWFTTHPKDFAKKVLPGKKSKRPSHLGKGNPEMKQRRVTSREVS